MKDIWHSKQIVESQGDFCGLHGPKPTKARPTAGCEKFFYDSKCLAGLLWLIKNRDLGLDENPPLFTGSGAWARACSSQVTASDDRPWALKDK